MMQPPPVRRCQSQIRKDIERHTTVQSNAGINALEFLRAFAASDSTNALIGLAKCLCSSQSSDGNLVGNMAPSLQVRNRRTTTL